MIILAIDPGNVQSAYVFLNDKGKILLCGKKDNYIVLQLIRKHREKIDHCVCEMIAQYGTGVGKTTFHTCIWIGEFRREFSKNDLELVNNFSLVYRKTYITMLCGDPRAKDANVRQAMIDRYGEPGTKKSPGVTYEITKDTWQALGLATFMLDLVKAGKYPDDIEGQMIKEYYDKIEERKLKQKKKKNDKDTED